MKGRHSGYLVSVFVLSTQCATGIIDAILAKNVLLEKDLASWWV